MTSPPQFFLKIYFIYIFVAIIVHINCEDQLNAIEGLTNDIESPLYDIA